MTDRNPAHGPAPRQAPLRVELGEALAVEAKALQRATESVAARLQEEFPAPLTLPLFVEAPWLRGHEYRIRFGDAELGSGRIWPGRIQATGPRERLRSLSGIRDSEPFFGEPCTWCSPLEATAARELGLERVAADQVLAGHLERIWRMVLSSQAALQEAERLLDEFGQSHPALVSRALRRIGLEPLRQVLGHLAEEGVPRPALRRALESLATQSPGSGDAESLTESLRVELGHWLCRPLAHRDALPCLTLDADLQSWLFNRVSRGERPRRGGDWIPQLARGLRDSLMGFQAAGSSPALLCLPSLRPTLARALKPALPDLRVLKTSEIDPTLQVLDLGRIRLHDWRMQAGLWLGSALLGNERRRQLRLELEEYGHCLQRRALSGPGRPQSPFRKPPRKSRPARPLDPTILTPLQKAAVLLLECPTWVLRELLSKLNPSEVNRLGREMIRMSPHCRVFRDRVLQELPGGAQGALELGQILEHLRGLLQEAARPETVFSELGLCLAVLPDPLRQSVESRVLAWIRTENAEALRAELQSLQAEANPHRAACALRRFVDFRRGGVSPCAPFGRRQVAAALQRAARSNPQGLAGALQRLWLCPEEHLPEDFIHWCEESPHRAAHWLVRWGRHWHPPGADPESQVLIVMQALPPELARKVREHLPPESRGLLKEDPSGEADPAEAARRCLEEFYLTVRPEAPGAVSLN